jgi:hypothetical protein
MDRRRTNIFYSFRSKGVRGKRKTTKAVEKKVGNTVRDKCEWKKQRDNVDREE